MILSYSREVSVMILLLYSRDSCILHCILCCTCYVYLSVYSAIHPVFLLLTEED